jgi:hypothetical protein
MFSILMSTVCRSAFAAYWSRGKVLLASTVGNIGPFGYCGRIVDGVGFELGVMYFSTHCLFVLSLMFAPDRHMKGPCPMVIPIRLKGIPC